MAPLGRKILDLLFTTATPEGPDDHGFPDFIIICDGLRERMSNGFLVDAVLCP